MPIIAEAAAGSMGAGTVYRAVRSFINALPPHNTTYTSRSLECALCALCSAIPGHPDVVPISMMKSAHIQ
jgi:hypothetical protein